MEQLTQDSDLKVLRHAFYACDLDNDGVLR
jgi:hypothetical protein